jgi:hypothetical protein
LFVQRNETAPHKQTVHPFSAWPKHAQGHRTMARPNHRDDLHNGRYPESFVLLMEDYNNSYTKALDGNPRLLKLPYAERASAAYELSIYYGNSYLTAFAGRGRSVEQFIPMCRPLQYAWAREHHIWTPPRVLSHNPFRTFWKQRTGKTPQRWALGRIVTEQIKTLRPDVLWIFSGIPITHQDMALWRRYAGQTVLWWSCPLEPNFPYQDFDLILSCIRPLVGYFRDRALRSEYLAHAFDRRILERVPPGEQRRPRVAFAGNLSRAHGERTAFLDGLARQVEVDLFGLGVEHTPEDSPLRGRYHGPVWGNDLYAVYGSYALVIHKNIDVAGTAASAKRLFEATGMGACVVTEAGDDLHELFRPDIEVVTYSSFEECVEKVRYLLAHPSEAMAIGRQGQRRTLAEHTYEHRVDQLLEYTRSVAQIVV